MPIQHPLIIGAGVAGLTAALAFARHGIRSTILEQATELTEVGAGLQISPNASRILATLGVLDTLSAVWLEPDDIRLVSGRSLRQITYVPCGQFARARWGAPYGTLHRATLQKALLEAVRANPLCTLILGRKPKLPGERSAEEILAEHGADLLVGADGVWSQTRTLISGAAPARFSGNLAWRFTLPLERAPSFIGRQSVAAFLGPTAHMVCYPLKESGLLNIVAVAAGSSTSHDWNLPGTEAQRALLRRRFASGWHPAISELLDKTDSATFWPLHEVGAGHWHNGRNAVLIGDAAHAMMPFAAQGAAMAIEDAFELAGMLNGRDAAEGLDIFEKRRAPRIAHLRQRAAFNRFAYHARGPFRLGRDVLLSLRPPQSLAADFDWIYGYQAVG